MCSIGIDSGLQVELFLRLNTALRSKLISNSCNTKFLVRLKSKYGTLNKTFFCINPPF